MGKTLTRRLVADISLNISFSGILTLSQMCYNAEHGESFVENGLPQMTTRELSSYNAKRGVESGTSGR